MYRFMSEEEIEIRQIKDLKMIHLYQLNGNDAIAAYYGDNKQINLCAMDENYNLLMEKILTLYSQCEDKDSIVIEDAAKRILDKVITRDIHHTSFFHRIGKIYAGQEGSLCPHFASDGMIRDTLIPMLQYYLQQLYHMWNMEIKFVQESIGWHRNCVLHAAYGDETFIMPVRITMLNEHNYKIVVGNFMHNLSNIEFEISYREDKLIVTFESTQMELFGESYFKITHQQLRAYTTIYVEGKVVYHEDEPIEQLTYTKEHLQQAYKQKVFFADMDSAFTYAAIYRLPWDDFMIYRNHHTQDEQYDRTDYDIIYVNEYQGKLVLRQYSYGLVEDKSNGLKLRTDGAVMRKIYYGDKRNEIETHFMPVGYYSGWDYKEYLEDKYFYHTTEEMQE